MRYSATSKLRRALRELGYIEIEGEWVKSHTKSSTSSNTVDDTDSSTSVKVIEKKELKTTTEQRAVLQLMTEEQETLRQMLTWYKRINSRSEGDTFIRIELPQSENVMISARSNKEVWEEFKEFAKKHSVNFKMGNLLDQALKEYIEKHEE